MTLDQWASMAEIFGAFGLIASLVYVGQQVRLNRKQVEEDAAGRFYERAHEIYLAAALERNFAEVWSKGASELDDLDKVDRERLINFEIGAINLWAQWYPQLKQGILPAHIERMLEWTLTGIGTRQSMREAWKIARPAFDDSFQQYVGGYLD